MKTNLEEILPNLEDDKFYVFGSNDGHNYFIDGAKDGYEFLPEAIAYARARWRRPGNEVGEEWTNYAVFNKKGEKLYTTGC